MNMRSLFRSGRLALGLAALAVIAVGLKTGPAAAYGGDDVVYIGDGGDNSIKAFDASTGAYLTTVVKSQAGLHGPRGLVLNRDGNLIVSDQNASTSTNGDISLYSSSTGKLLSRIVSHSDPNSPEVPRGIILYNHTIFVADLTTQTQSNKPTTPGRLLAYQDDGTFLADLTPATTAFPRDKFHPRALVIGPDGLLYVSNMPNLPLPPAVGTGGQVLRFDPVSGAFIDVYLSDDGGVGKLNRPEGIVFGPDGNLYMATFRADATDTDKIRIYQGPGGASPGTPIASIDLDAVGSDRAPAQALLFGPGGHLFVPISGTGPDSGSVRRYDVGIGLYDVFIPPSAQGGALQQPWYLTFGQTSASSLVYQGN
jgi:DNA-binding beta-propeller fold protein YncE